MMESIHTFGLCLLIVRVLPTLDLVRSLLIMCGVGIVPSLINVVMGLRPQNNMCKKVIQKWTCIHVFFYSIVMCPGIFRLHIEIVYHDDASLLVWILFDDKVVFSFKIAFVVLDIIAVIFQISVLFLLLIPGFIENTGLWCHHFIFYAKISRFLHVFV